MQMRLLLILTMFSSALVACAADAPPATPQRPAPVIIDTDIGGDIDDTWALAMLLKSPELDVKLVLTDTADTVYRARIAARLLDVAGRTDVAVGVGMKQKSDGPRERQREWIKDYELAKYPGKVHDDGVQAMIDMILASPEPISLICVGPSPNIGEALRREPRIAAKTKFFGMFGSFGVHHTTNRKLSVQPGRIPEWNVVKDIAAAKAIFAAPWAEATITPLDTCAYIVFDGARYQRLRESKDPLMRAVIENYDIWAKGNAESNAQVHSSVLYDTVAVYLAFSTKHIRMQRMKVRVDDKGYTVEAADALPLNVAMAWTNLDAFMDFLAERLLGPVIPSRSGAQR